jgi:hypothetical protein
MSAINMPGWHQILDFRCVTMCDLVASHEVVTESRVLKLVVATDLHAGHAELPSPMPELDHFSPGRVALDLAAASSRALAEES